MITLIFNFFWLTHFLLFTRNLREPALKKPKKNQLNTPLGICWSGQIKECFESPPIANRRRSRVVPQRCTLPPAVDAKLINIPGLLIIMPKTLYIVNTRPPILSGGRTLYWSQSGLVPSAYNTWPSRARITCT